LTAAQVPKPDVRLCAGCHQQAERRFREATRHAPQDDRAFDHRKHLPLESIAGQCVKCHEGVVQTGPTALLNPPMSRCLTCHQEDFDQANCTRCHTTKYLARTKPLTFMRHDAGWVRTHGLEATGRSERVCAQCHSQTTCVDCHAVYEALSLEKRRPDAISTTQVHRGDFLTVHAMESRAAPATCTSCHTPASCDSCHLQRGVSAGGRDALSPHGPGWVGSDASAGNHHGRAARRSIAECAGCHDQGPRTNCIQCHRPGAPGGNPHPSGWGSSARSFGSLPCRYCHE
jgi:hypothetical protein